MYERLYLLFLMITDLEKDYFVERKIRISRNKL